MKRIGLMMPVVALAASCSTMEPRDFAADSPAFDPMEFFSGTTESRGVMENRSGEPVGRVLTRTRGKQRGDVLFIEQDLEIDGKNSHRSWQLRRIDEHHYEATANDIVGVARGEAFGNVFHWSFMLDAVPGNPLGHVRMSQWMYLQPGGRTLVNHTTFSKLGVKLRQVTEQFQKR